MRSYCDSSTKDLRTESGSAPSAHGLEFQATHLASAGGRACPTGFSCLAACSNGMERGSPRRRHCSREEGCSKAYGCGGRGGDWWYACRRCHLHGMHRCRRPPSLHRRALPTLDAHPKSLCVPSCGRWMAAGMAVARRAVATAAPPAGSLPTGPVCPHPRLRRQLAGRAGCAPGYRFS